MEIFAAVWLLSLAVILLLLWKVAMGSTSKKGNLPPMPYKLPLVGHLLFMDPKQPYKTVTNWGAKFGPVFRLFFGMDEMYVLNSYEAIKEAFVRQGDNFVGRPNLWLLTQITEQKHGLVFADGDRWREQRRFALSRLRDFGFGKAIMSTKIQLEIDDLLDQLDSSAGSASVDLLKEVKYCAANIITSVVFGTTFERGDVEFEHFQKLMDESMRIIGLAGFLMAFPILRYIIPGGLGYWDLLKSKKQIHTFHQKQIDKHKECLAHNSGASEMDDFVMEYLKEMARQHSDKSHYFSETQLRLCVGDLFFAGQETTVTTLKWTFLYLLYNPEIQERMFNEMLEKVGQQPSLIHRGQLAYCQAVVMEAQRIGNIIPFGVMHSTIANVKLMGFDIPKGSTILPNMWAVLMDPELFPEPSRFDPNRFLDENGLIKSKTEGFIPFSIGKRQCLGESLAKAELFMILAAVVWNYRLRFDENFPMPSLDPELGFTLSPEHYMVQLEKRKSQ